MKTLSELAEEAREKLGDSLDGQAFGICKYCGCEGIIPIELIADYEQSE